ncbi:MAG: hypothetical protein LBI54_06220 [Lachnospiraceae bacterium]|jgi:hypothetical protein|nr:hypothetical protein [Lachnospiraceae bacterium]
MGGDYIDGGVAGGLFGEEPGSDEVKARGVMKVFLAVFVILVYFVPISVFLTLSGLIAQETPNLSYLIIPVAFMALVCLLAAVSIALAVRATKRQQCLSVRAVAVFKLCLIPFYVVNFACWAFAMGVFHIALFVWPLIPFIILYTYLTMLGTSAHSVAHLLALRRESRITTGVCAVHCIAQFIFVLDVLDGIYLAINARTWSKAT